jgi:5-hydroxyisourate hydrolase-like protein (transthyretin family)
MAASAPFRLLPKPILRVAFSVIGLLQFPQCLLAASWVEVIACQPAEQRATITAIVDSTTVNNFELTIVGSDGKKIRSVRPNKSGVLALPRLRPGRYSLHGRTADDKGGDLCLDVSAKTGAQMFLIELRPVPHPQPTLAELLVAKIPPEEEHLRVVRGSVLDPSGAAISGVSIQIYKKQARSRKPVKEVRSDTSGRYGVDLSDGMYVIVFQAPGFHPRFVAVQIGRAGEDRELHITLKLGEVT